MTRELASALSGLRRIDARIDARAPARRSLDPTRERAHPLESVMQTLFGDRVAVDPAAAHFASALAKIAEAQLSAFPDNIFWDFDLVARVLLSAAADDDRGRERLSRTSDLMCRLHQRFGEEPIAFRYAHDFVYGFDWARWVARDPEARAGVGPFDDAFLQALFDRGADLIELIARDDVKYPQLHAASGRNSFAFSREPEHETTLLVELSRRGTIPVEAWRVDAEPRWDHPYQEIRETLAKELGIPAPQLGD